MKKALISVITASIILGSSMVVFADETTPTTTTPAVAPVNSVLPVSNTTTSSGISSDQTSNTTTSSGISADQPSDPTLAADMASIVDLREQTKAAVKANNATSKQIKEAIKLLCSNSDLIIQVRDAEKKVKLDVYKIRRLQMEERRSRRHHWYDNINDSEAQDTNSDIDMLKQQLATDRDTLKSLVEQLKASKSNISQIKETLKPLVQSAIDLDSKIRKEEEAKNDLWNTYDTQYQSGDFTSADATLKSIITAKTQILSDIQARGTALTSLLNKINSLIPGNSDQTTTAPTINTTNNSAAADSDY